MPLSVRTAIGLALVCGAVARGQAPTGSPEPAFAVGSVGPYAVTPVDDPQVSSWAGRELVPAEPPGWFGALTLGVVRPHLGGNISGVGPGLPFAELDWTALPRIEVGYRLADGAGDLRAGYHLLDASGAGSEFPGGIHTRLDLNAIDLDYLSAEWLTEATPDLFRNLRLVGGLRIAEAAVRSSGPLWDFRSDTCGAGPRFGIEYRKPIPAPRPMELYLRTEATGLVAETRQTIGYGLSTPWQWSGAAAVLAEVGFGWWPMGPDGVRVQVGYQLEQWWNLGRTDAANVDLSVHGAFVRAEWRY
jgi:hypothetical protein